MTFRGRRRGTRVVYSPQQTLRYKSQLARWRRGGWLLRIYWASPEEKRDGLIAKFFYLGRRSSTGVWTVVVSTLPEPEPPEDDDEGDGGDDEDDPLSALIEVTWTDLVGVFVYYRWHYLEGTTNTTTTSILHNERAGSVRFVDYYPFGTTEVVTHVTTSGCFSGFAATNTIASWRYKNHDGEVIFSKLLSWNSSVSPCDDPPSPNHKTYETFNGSRQLFVTADGVPLTFGSGPSGSPAPPEEEEEEEEKPLFFSCDCPDLTEEQAKLPRSRWPSEHRDRNWQGSGAGSAGACKHIYHARRYFLPDEDPPDDSDFGDGMRTRPDRPVPPIQFEFADPPEEPPDTNRDWESLQRVREQRRRQRERQRQDQAADRVLRERLSRSAEHGQRYRERQAQDNLNDTRLQRLSEIPSDQLSLEEKQEMEDLLLEMGERMEYEESRGREYDYLNQDAQSERLEREAVRDAQRQETEQYFERERQRRDEAARLRSERRQRQSRPPRSTQDDLGKWGFR